MKIITTAKTELGEVALNKHIEESFKLNLALKTQKKLLGISQEVTSKVPLTLVIEISKRLSALVRPEDFRREVVTTMKKNGAKKNIDFSVEVE